jgi:hypothetical protein
MPFDGTTAREPWGDPWWHRCRSCKQPIGPNEPIENVRLQYDDVHQSHRINGIYHAGCAKPYLGLVRALETATALTR